MRQALIEILNRHIEGFRKFEQTAGADAVGAAFIFLDLLKTNPDGFCQLLLGQTQKPAPAPQTFSNVKIDIICHNRVPPILRLLKCAAVGRSPETRAKRVPREAWLSCSPYMGMIMTVSGRSSSERRFL
jgi:hypothetical protein